MKRIPSRSALIMIRFQSVKDISAFIQDPDYREALDKLLKKARDADKIEEHVRIGANWTSRIL